MTPYIVVLITVCAGCALGALSPPAHQRAIAFPLILLLAMFAALRGYVGTDTYAYHEMFDTLRHEDLRAASGIVEPIFALMAKAVSQVSASAFVFVGAIAIVQGIVLYLIVARHSQPLVFLGLYVATFYVNFHFNILRGGLAALLLVLSATYLLDGSRTRFLITGLLSVLSHYSSVLFFVPMSFVGQRIWSRLVWLITSLILGGLVVWIFIGEDRWFQYLSYLLIYDVDDSVQYGIGLVVLFALYAAMFAIQASQDKIYLLTFLLLSWYVARLASNHFLFVDRIEILINIILLFLISQRPNRPRKRVPLLAICLMLMSLNVYGTLNGLVAADQSTRGSFAAELERNSPTYLPYRFAWDE